MKVYLKKYWKTLILFILVGLVGGFFTGLYVLNSYPEETKQLLIEEVNALNLGISVELVLGIITAYQAAGYGLFLGALGIVFGKKVGLWKDETNIKRKPLLITLCISLFSGLLMILPDLLIFGPLENVIIDSYATKPDLISIFAGILYGGVIEEVMLRLFFMSFIAYVLFRVFEKNNAKPSTKIFIISNFISAILFGVLHLPANFQILGDSLIIIVRCIVLNGGIGLLFGCLYRKYGLRYSMIAHAGSHIISKLIWILFI